MLYIKKANTLNRKTEHASKKTIEIVIAKDQIRSALFLPKEIRSCIMELS